MDNVDDGGIHIVNDPIDNPVTCTSSVVRGDVDWENGEESTKEDFQRYLTQFLESGTSNIESRILSTLENQHKLVLPASGTFHMMNPMFNQKGDLLVDLWYQG